LLKGNALGTGGVAQVVEDMTSQPEALSSNSSTAKKKKTKKYSL
jgi:hypothetical protein